MTKKLFSLRSMFRNVVANMNEALDISLHLKPLRNHYKVSLEAYLSYPIRQGGQYVLFSKVQHYLTIKVQAFNCKEFGLWAVSYLMAHHLTQPPDNFERVWVGWN